MKLLVNGFVVFYMLCIAGSADAMNTRVDEHRKVSGFHGVSNTEITLGNRESVRLVGNDAQLDALS